MGPKANFWENYLNMPTTKRIAILGAGAMGGAYATMFNTVDAFDTLFVARGPRAERLAQNGLIVNGKPIHLPVVRPDQTTAPADLVMVALKLPKPCTSNY